MTDHTELFTVGEIAGQTGLSARTVRFYSDEGLVSPSDRTSGGYRLYDREALERLQLIRTLRELGFGLPMIRRVIANHTSLADTAAAELAALDAQIRILRLRRSVLQVVVDRGTTTEEIQLMHKLAQLSERERQQIISDFWDEVCHGQGLSSDAERQLRAATPQLPDNPTAEEVTAWIELAELVADPSFRNRLREITAALAATPPEEVVMPTETQQQAMADAIASARQAATEHLDHHSGRGQEVLDQAVAAYAYAPGDVDTPEFRARLADRLAARTHPDVEQYTHLIAVIDGGRRPPPTVPAVQWIIDGLRRTR